MTLNDSASMPQIELINELKTIDCNVEYYAITLLGTSDGRIHWSTQTHWAGWVGGKPGREIREASIVNADFMAKYWTDVGQGYLVVTSIRALVAYLRLGGNAFVSKAIAEKYLNDMVKPQETAFAGFAGFKFAKNLPPETFKRAPRPKHRMRIIQRDNSKCKICGRRPDNCSDIELHVHHILPWEKGGLTEDDNLVTLCHTCHAGLEPHSQLSVLSLVKPDAFEFNTEKARQEYFEGVRSYRDIAGAMFAKSKGMKKRSGGKNAYPRVPPDR